MLAHTLYPLFRRVEFRGKGRLRSRLPVPSEGTPVVAFPGGMRLRLDLRESLQRDFYFGLYDLGELRYVARHLRTDPRDFVDVGAHVGVYTVRAALELRGSARVLAFEPNPAARAQLLENVRLNGAGNVVVSDAAVGATGGRASLHVPATPDPSFSSLDAGRFAEGEPVEVEVTTVDDAVARHGIAPAFVKIDVEGREVDVVRGMERTLAEHRPELLVEVNERSGEEIGALLPSHTPYRIERGRLVPYAGGRGLFNAVFLANRR